MLTLLALQAHALPPDHEVKLWTVGELSAGAVERMDITIDGGLVVGRTRADSVAWLVDVDRWDLLTFSGVDSADACAVNGVAPVALEDGTFEIWLACADGTVKGHAWNGTDLTDVLDGSDRLTFEVDTQLSGIWYDPYSVLFYAISLTGTYEQAVVHVIDPFNSLVDSAVYPSYPKTLPANGFVEAAVVEGYLVVSHGNQDMTSLQLGLDSAVGITNVFSTPFHCQDLAPSPFTGVYCVDELGSVAEYRPLTNNFTVLPLGVLSTPQAVSASLDLDDGWIAVTGDQVKVWEMDSTGAVLSTTPYFEGPPDADNPIQDMVNAEGYLYGGGEGGGLHLVTARPWVYPESVVVTPASAVSGETVTVTFQVDTDTDWALHLGGDRTGSGPVLASGSTDADTDVVVELVVDDTYIEGDNGLYAVATNPLNNLVGHARGSLFVDDPPSPPTLTDANVLFGDGELTLSFDGIPDEDLDRYEIFVAEAPYVAADWPTGGPAWDGSTSLSPPLSVVAKGGEHVSKRIVPLENDVTYYIGVHAWDTGGKEGPMSRVVKGTPSQVFNASELAGDEGGTPCSTGPGPGALGLGLAALATARRRRRVAGAALLALLVLPAAARAQDDEDRWWRQDTTATHANFELRYGTISLLDQRIEQIYDQKPHNIAYLEVGPQFVHVVELDLGFGFMQDLAFSQSEAGLVSGERTMLTWWPLALDGTLRGHFVDEQPVVPFLRYGWDYVLWSEKRDEGTGKATTQGGKFGTHFSLGGNVLLDVFQPGRASFLETQTGINDSWITLEWRRQRVDARSAPWAGRDDRKLDFSGDSFTVGLKLDW